MTILVLFLVSIFAGVFGAVLGLGGGVIVVPTLALYFGIPMKYAVGAGLITSIAASSGSAAAYVKDELTNVRLAILLETMTTTGAITGVYLSGIVPNGLLLMIFAAVLFYSVAMMYRKRKQADTVALPEIADPLADRLKLHGRYFDQHLKRDVAYKVVRTPLGLALMYFAGVLSALLGIGSGALKVPAMDTGMRLPLKVSSATSSFMIGVTAATSTMVYFLKGQILPFVVGPVAIGVLVGATLGSRWMAKMSTPRVRQFFVFVLLALAIQALWKGVTSL